MKDEAPVQPVAFPDLPLTPYQRSDGAPLWDTHHLHAYALRYAAMLATPPAAQPAQKPWVDLTDEEIMTAPENLIACIAYVRNKLREKNAAPPPAAPVQPVASLNEVDVLMMAEAHGIDPNTKGLYGFYIDCISNQPAAQRQWVGLTDDERLEVAEIDGADEWFWKVCKAIEAKLKEKNA
jgi:hypothetical protein